MKKKRSLLSLLAVCFCFVSCSTTNSLQSTGTSIKILETIPNISTPDWVNSTTDYWEEKDSYVYRSKSEGMTQLAVAQRVANANALINIAKQVKNSVKMKFNQTMEASAYDATTCGYLKDTFFSVIDNLTLTLNGANTTSFYVQRISETNSSGERLYYRAYVLVYLSKDAYKQSVQKAFTDTITQVSALVAETEKRFFGAVEGSDNK